MYVSMQIGFEALWHEKGIGAGGVSWALGLGDGCLYIRVYYSMAWSSLSLVNKWVDMVFVEVVVQDLGDALMWVENVRDHVTQRMGRGIVEEGNYSMDILRIDGILGLCQCS